MGKANKLKRIRRLKEAKLKREQELLADSGLDPASVELRKRAEKSGVVIRNNQSTTKYSDLLKYFVHPIIAHEDEIDIVKKKFVFGIMAWNAVIMKEKSEENFLKAKQKIISILLNSTEMSLLFDGMVQRKQEEFAEYKKLILDFEIKEISETQYHLSVVTTQ